MVRVLHTADWHLGRWLHEHRRLDESKAFLDWLFQVIRDESIDVVLVAGDIFDSVAPGTKALEVYHAFLASLFKDTKCQHVVITAGNHDSPSLLESSAAVLKELDIHVVGVVRDDPSDEVLVLTDERKQPSLIVAAVPYLRDQDIRISTANESLIDKDRRLYDAIASHYRAVGEAAVHANQRLAKPVPMIAMGHLFVTDGKMAVETGDGVRELYVGTLGQVSVEIFPPVFDYVALGHLHIAHPVGTHQHVRYSGSPIPMGFGEAGQTKVVYVIDFQDRTRHIRPIAIPVFQELVQVIGDWPAIEARLRELVESNSQAWLEIVYEGEEWISDLEDRAAQCIASSRLKILKQSDRQRRGMLLAQSHIAEDLDDLTPEEVFQRQMEMAEIPLSQQGELMAAYREILFALENPEAEE